MHRGQSNSPNQDHKNISVSGSGRIAAAFEHSLDSDLRQISPQLRSISPDSLDWLRTQKLVNRLVTMLANGDTAFMRRKGGDWIYRFLSPEPNLWRGSARIQELGEFSGRIAKYVEGNRITAHDIYKALRESDNFLDQPPEDIPSELRRYTVEPLSSAGRPHPIATRMRKDLIDLGSDVSVYLHGSMAIGDFTAFSDVDDLVILHKSSWNSFEKFSWVIRRLEKTARLFQAVDPLQHHGHWLFLDSDLVCLDQSVMPLVVLDESIVVTGRNTIHANVRDWSWGIYRVLWTIIQEVRQSSSFLEGGSINLFELKNLIAGISLLPALCLQARGEIVDKRTAIGQSDVNFSASANLAIQWATKLRKEWESSPSSWWFSAARHANRFLPFRRSALETISKRTSPTLQLQTIPYYSIEVLEGILNLANECTLQLQVVLMPEGELAQ